MECIIISSYDELTEADLEELRSQDLIIEDWDFIFFIPPENCSEGEIEVEELHEDGYYFMKKIKKQLPDWKIQSLIEGSAYSVQYHDNITFRGKKWVFAMREH